MTQLNILCACSCDFVCYIRFHVQIRKGSLSIHGLLISLRTGFFCSQVRLTSTSSRKINKILQFFEFVPPGILSSPMYVFVYLRVSRKCTLRIRSQLKTNKTARQQWTNDKTVEWKQKAVCELLKERFVHSNCAVFCARHAFRRRFFLWLYSVCCCHFSFRCCLCIG